MRIAGIGTAAAALGVPVGPPDIARFEDLHRLVAEARRSLNLTGITDEGRFAVDHLLDALSVVPHIDLALGRGAPATLVDVGSGAGFPALPIAMVRPALAVVALESHGRKAAFIARAAAALGLANVRADARRAEDAGRDPSLRERAGVATARAVGSLATVLELTLPLVAPGGSVILHRGAAAAAEAAAAAHAIEVLGGAPPRVVRAEIPERTERFLVIVEKVRPTPERYPRRAGTPARTPLE